MLDNLPPSETLVLQEETDVEAKNQNFQHAVSGTLNSAADLINIANRIGVSPQIVSDAQTGLAFAQDAATAFADFSSGNILGGISAVSNVFGLGGPDVNALNYQHILQSLGVINDQLSTITRNEAALFQGEQAIIQNQQQELNALGDLSKQLETSHEQEMTSIERTDQDVLYDRSLLAATATKSYGADCPYILSDQSNGGNKASPYVDTAHQIIPIRANVHHPLHG
jgi:hypothetical protein